MTDVKALTVKQPLAWAIVHGLKGVENRSWRFPMPLGTTIAVHAGRKVVPLEELPVRVDVPDDFARGAVVGFADVVDDHHADECQARHGFLCSAWAYPDTRHWVLANPRLLDTPIPHRGYLWLFTPTDEVAVQLRAALRG